MSYRDFVFRVKSCICTVVGFCVAALKAIAFYWRPILKVREIDDDTRYEDDGTRVIRKVSGLDIFDSNILYNLYIYTSFTNSNESVADMAFL